MMLAAFMAVLIALVATACGDDDDSGSGDSGTSSAPAETEPLKIALDWTPNTNHTGIYVAQAEGYFEEQGLDVEILPYSGASTDVLVNEGKADLGVSFVPSLLVSRTSGLDIKAVSAIINDNVESLAVLEKSKYQSPKDLATGTTYGGFGLPYEVPLWTEVIRADGANEVDFKNVTLNTAAYEALYAEKIDWSAIFDYWEGIEAKNRNVALRTFPIEEYLGEAGNYPSVIFVASDEGIQNNPEKIQKALAALSEGYTYAVENPQEAAQILIDADPALGKATEQVTESADGLAEHYIGDASQWGEISPEAIEGLGTILAEGGALTGPDGAEVKTIDFAEYYTNDLLPQQ